LPEARCELTSTCGVHRPVVFTAPRWSTLARARAGGRVEGERKRKLQVLRNQVLLGSRDLLARPAIASERLSIDPDGRVVYRLRRPWSDGTSAIVFEPLAFLERLAALVPRPRAHLLTYHGVLAPAAQWRDRIVPGPRVPTESDHGSTEPRATCSSRPATSSSPDSPAALSNPARTRRLRWAELLRRVFAVDVLTCPNCGGARRLIATITDGLVVRRILDHLDLPSSPPPIAPARAPPELEFAW
jgi:hypothetical protein